MSIDHKAITDALKKATNAKVSFSKSPRKGGKEFWAWKLEATPERIEAVEMLIAEEKVTPCAIFFSKDKSTTGLMVMANTDGTI